MRRAIVQAAVDVAAVAVAAPAVMLRTPRAQALVESCPVCNSQLVVGHGSSGEVVEAAQSVCLGEQADQGLHTLGAGLLQSCSEPGVLAPVALC